MAAIAAAMGATLLLLGRRHSKRGLVLAGLLWFAYGLWEAVVQWFTPQANIRVDLLLIYPVLIGGTLIALLSVYLSSRRNRRAD